MLLYVGTQVHNTSHVITINLLHLLSFFRCCSQCWFLCVFISILPFQGLSIEIWLISLSNDLHSLTVNVLVTYVTNILNSPHSSFAMLGKQPDMYPVCEFIITNTPKWTKYNSLNNILFCSYVVLHNDSWIIHFMCKKHVFKCFNS